MRCGIHVVLITKGLFCAIVGWSCSEGAGIYVYLINSGYHLKRWSERSLFDRNTINPYVVYFLSFYLCLCECVQESVLYPFDHPT